MEESSGHVTHRQIAELAGVHRATVSLALKNHPSIGLATRKRIHALAEKLGYRPDPMLSALASYSRRQRAPAFQGVIGWLSHTSPTFRWDQFATFQAYHRGAVAAAERYGYKLEIFEMSPEDKPRRRLASILRARSINGILLPPQPEASVQIDFPWEHFASVTFGYTLRQPGHHVVTTAHFRAMIATLRRLRERGYQRIAFAYAKTHDERVDHNYLAGYLLEQRLAGAEVLIAPGDDYDQSGGAFHSWRRETGIDAIVTGNFRVVDDLARAGVSVPHDLGVACPSLPSPGLGVSGVYERTEAIGKIAVDFLVSLLHQGERGVPDAPQHILVEGQWCAGNTLRPAKKPPRKR